MIIRDAFHLVGGGTPSTAEPKYWGAGIPWISSSDIDDFHNISVRRFVTDKGVEESATNRVSKGTVIVVTRVGLGKVALLPQDMCFSQDIQALIPKPNISINTRFILFQLTFIMSSLKYSSQGTTISGITKKQLSDASLYLPPLPEQERIVARIEELFSELDKGVEALQTIKAQLRVYRQAVLKEAFEGCVKFQQIRSCSSLVTSGSRGWAQYYSPEGAAFIRIGNLTQDRILIDFSDTQFVQLPDKAEGTRSLLKPSDILVSITANLGSIALVTEAIQEAYINQHIALIRLKNPSLARCYAWYLRCDFGQKDLLRNKRGAGKLGLGLDDIRETHVPIISDTDAEKIVENIESHLSVCDQIEKTVDESLAKAESLRQSILKKAFEGRL